MILIVDAIFRGIHCPNMVRLVEDYEGAFETLNELFSQGFQLQGAIIKEGDSQLKVPVEAFDGRPIDLHLRALQTQWDQLLAVKSTPVTSTDYSLKAWLMGLDGDYDAFLAHLEKMIFLLQVQKGKIKSWRSVEVRNSLTQRVDTLLAINQRMHKQTLESRRINQERMHQLQK